MLKQLARVGTVGLCERLDHDLYSVGPLFDTGPEAAVANEVFRPFPSTVLPPPPPNTGNGFALK